MIICLFVLPREPLVHLFLVDSAQKDAQQRLMSRNVIQRWLNRIIDAFMIVQNHNMMYFGFNPEPSVLLEPQIEKGRENVVS